MNELSITAKISREEIVEVISNHYCVRGVEDFRPDYNYIVESLRDEDKKHWVFSAKEAIRALMAKRLSLGLFERAEIGAINGFNHLNFYTYESFKVYITHPGYEIFILLPYFKAGSGEINKLIFYIKGSIVYTDTSIRSTTEYIFPYSLDKVYLGVEMRGTVRAICSDMDIPFKEFKDVEDLFSLIYCYNESDMELRSVLLSVYLNYRQRVSRALIECPDKYRDNYAQKLTVDIRASDDYKDLDIYRFYRDCNGELFMAFPVTLENGVYNFIVYGHILDSYCVKLSSTFLPLEDLENKEKIEINETEPLPVVANTEIETIESPVESEKETATGNLHEVSNAETVAMSDYLNLPVDPKITTVIVTHSLNFNGWTIDLQDVEKAICEMALFDCAFTEVNLIHVYETIVSLLKASNALGACTPFTEPLNEDLDYFSVKCHIPYVTNDGSLFLVFPYPLKGYVRKLIVGVMPDDSKLIISLDVSTNIGIDIDINAPHKKDIAKSIETLTEFLSEDFGIPIKETGLLDILSSVVIPSRQFQVSTSHILCTALTILMDKRKNTPLDMYGEPYVFTLVDCDILESSSIPRDLVNFEFYVDAKGRNFIYLPIVYDGIEPSSYIDNFVWYFHKDREVYFSFVESNAARSFEWEGELVTIPAKSNMVSHDKQIDAFKDFTEVYAELRNSYIATLNDSNPEFSLCKWRKEYYLLMHSPGTLTLINERDVFSHGLAEMTIRKIILDYLEANDSSLITYPQPKNSIKPERVYRPHIWKNEFKRTMLNIGVFLGYLDRHYIRDVDIDYIVKNYNVEVTNEST